MSHNNLINYLSSIEETKFGASLGSSGGYISFRNTGKGSNVKEFTLSFESILSGFQDIIDNLSEFERCTSYVEGEWRSLGGSFFSDVALSSIITVQTKPTFTTFSKIICWANDLDYVGDNAILLSPDYISIAMNKVQSLIDMYKPRESVMRRLSVDSDVFTKLPKPFILLAGISGTGKTRYVREQAAGHNVGDENFCLVPVRPDWHEPSDLLGYISRIGGKPEYVTTKVLQFVIDAWKAVAPDANSDGMGELKLAGVPYWLCLDEMNLAPVEQYFSDYLSVLESRKFSDGVYTCDPLLDKSVLETEGADIQKDLKLNTHQDLWDYFCINGIGLPPNLIVAGTVNMDETTHGFSRKVIDRALSIDFGEFFPNDYSKFFKGQDVPKTLTYSTETHVNEGTFRCAADSDGSQTVAFLEEINGVLRDTPFELAYRALNELLLYVNSFGPDSDEKLQAVWDDFLMMKVLPRIDGDDDKLRIIVDGKSYNLLENLETVLSKQLELIWGEDKTRVDLIRDDENGAEISDISCRSRKKIKWMRNRLDINTFTSYWP